MTTEAALDKIRAQQSIVRKPYALELCEALEDCLAWYDGGESVADFPAERARSVLNKINLTETEAKKNK